jgi:hypothetical protein
MREGWLDVRVRVECGAYSTKARGVKLFLAEFEVLRLVRI